MAAAFLNRRLPGSKPRAIAAAAIPPVGVHLEVAEIMGEAGIEASELASELLTQEMIRDCCLLVTFGTVEGLILPPGTETLVWMIPDPRGLPREKQRMLRDMILHHIDTLLEDARAGRPHREGASCDCLV